MQPYFDDGQITIYHGSALDVLPHITADVIVTDPPYGVGLSAFDDDFSVSPVALNMTPGNLAAVFMSPRRVFELARAMESSWHFERMLWMHKEADIAMPWRGWCMNSEAVMLFSRPGAVWPKPSDFRSDVYRVGPWERAGHPNGKPVSVVRDLIRRLTTPDSVILDPFLGSGTTARAALDLGRQCIGIEKEERYCEIAVRRLAQQAMPLAI